MSQAGIISTTTGPVPPIVPTQFTADDATVAIPAGNNLNIFTVDTTANFDNGIHSTASGSTMTIQLTNRGTGSTTTADATLTTITTFLPPSDGVYYFDGDFIGNNTTDVAGAGYGFASAFRVTAGAVTEISTEFKDLFEEANMAASDVFVTTDGTNILFQVQGIAGKTINWSNVFTYRLRT